MGRYCVTMPRAFVASVLLSVVWCVARTVGVEDTNIQGYGGGQDGAQDGYGEMMQSGYGGQEAGKPLCPAGKTPVTKRGYEAYGNGCGTAGISVSSEFNFTSCCTYTHDVCYVTCGMKKANCESEFGDCMNKYCTDNHADRVGECKQNAGMYTMGTTMMGGKYFREGQVEACECVPEKDGRARRKEELRDFYKKWAPDQLHKADSLFAKYEANFPKLRM